MLTGTLDEHQDSAAHLTRVNRVVTSTCSAWPLRPSNGHQRGALDSGSSSKARDGVAGWDLPSTNFHSPWGAAEAFDAFEYGSILIIDDCTLYRETLATIFAANDIAMPSVAWDLPSLVAALHDISPTVILLSMGTRESKMLLRASVEFSPSTRVIALGLSEDDEREIIACAEAGVAGYHMRTESLDDLLVLIRKVAAGGAFCSPGVSAILLRRLSTLAAQKAPVESELVLTAREAQILRMLEMGLSNRDIGAQLCIAVHTVKNHVHAVLTKLGVSSRAEAAARYRAMRHAEGDEGTRPGPS